MLRVLALAPRLPLLRLFSEVPNEAAQQSKPARVSKTQIILEHLRKVGPQPRGFIFNSLKEHFNNKAHLKAILKDMKLREHVTATRPKMGDSKIYLYSPAPAIERKPKDAQKHAQPSQSRQRRPIITGSRPLAETNAKFAGVLNRDPREKKRTHRQRIRFLRRERQSKDIAVANRKHLHHKKAMKQRLEKLQQRQQQQKAASSTN